MDFAWAVCAAKEFYKEEVSPFHVRIVAEMGNEMVLKKIISFWKRISQIFSGSVKIYLETQAKERLRDTRHLMRLPEYSLAVKILAHKMFTPAAEAAVALYDKKYQEGAPISIQLS
jgi:hypothetical protein